MYRIHSFCGIIIAGYGIIKNLHELLSFFQGNSVQFLNLFIYHFKIDSIIQLVKLMKFRVISTRK
jgi:hypothetical protein